MNKKFVVFIKIVVFITIFTVINRIFTYFLFGHASHASWLRQNALYEMEKDSVEIAVCGSSMLQVSFLYLEVYHNTGIKSIQMSNPCERLEITYYKIKEMYKRQKPQVLLVDLLLAMQDKIDNIDDENKLHYSLDFLKLNFNKILAVNSIISKEKRLEYIFPILYYHSNWKKAVYNINPYLDMYNTLLNNIFTEDIYVLNSSLPIEEFDGKLYEELKNNISFHDEEDTYLNPYIEKIIKIAKENGSKVVFTFTPVDINSFFKETQRFENSRKYITEKYNDKDIHFLNLNDYVKELDINYSKDFFDTGHLNYLGAQKVTKFMINYLYENFDINIIDKNKDKWNEAYENYVTSLK